MKKLLFPLLLAFSFSAGAIAQETVTLTTPITSTITAKHVGIVCENLDNSSIYVQIENISNTTLVTKTYDATTVPAGATLLHQLNVGNFSINSMMKAVYNRLITDGIIEAGSVTGSPQ